MNPAPTIHLFLGPDTRAPSRARRAMRSELESVLEADLLDQATLLVSELVTNSVRHGGGRGVLRLWQEPDAFVCEIRDNGRFNRPLVDRERPAKDIREDALRILSNHCHVGLSFH